MIKLIRDDSQSDGRQGSDLFWALITVAIAFAILGAMTLAENKCKRLPNEHDRLACYDAAADTQPAKGASAITH
jgi:hypothetical protein